MKDAIWMDRSKWRDFWLATGTFLVTVLLTSWVGTRQPSSYAAVLACAATTAAGTLVVALILARWTPYPRWGHFGAVVVLAGGVLFSTVLIADPVLWMKDVRSGLWMYPWCFIVVSLFAPRGGSGWCAPAAPWAGWLLIGRSPSRGPRRSSAPGSDRRIPRHERKETELTDRIAIRSCHY